MKRIMGTDIHFLVQIQTGQDWKNLWKLIPTEVFLQEEPEFSSNPLKTWVCESFYEDRNYELFSMLAHVRSDDFECITPPRGLPADLKLIDECAVFPDYPEGGTDCLGSTDRFWIGDHSHSWVTLQELLEYFEFYPEHQEPAGDFYSQLIPELMLVASEHGLKYEQVRCVFGFDS